MTARSGQNLAGWSVRVSSGLCRLAVASAGGVGAGDAVSRIARRAFASPKYQQFFNALLLKIRHYKKAFRAHGLTSGRAWFSSSTASLVLLLPFLGLLVRGRAVVEVELPAKCGG